MAGTKSHASIAALRRPAAPLQAFLLQRALFVTGFPLVHFAVCGRNHHATDHQETRMV
jgi:hypothetical protein